MKKTFLLKSMLLLFALIAGSSSVWATDPDLTLDFTSAWTEGSDNSDGEKVFTKTVGTTTYTISGIGSDNFKFNTGYFMFGKTNAYVKLPKVDFEVEKIEVVGRSGASGNVVHNIFVGDAAASTAVTGLNGTTSTFNISSSYQAANTQYILKVTSNHNAQVTYVKYYKKTSGGGGSTVYTPSFDPVEGTYTTAQSVTLACSTDGATIHYTMTEDGTTPDDPTESDATYSSAISVTKSGTKIKAKAFKAEMTASSVASATYTIKPNAPTITGGANVTITGDDGLTFYYTTDNSAPTNASTEYTAPFTPEDCTVRAIAYDTYGNSSSVTVFKYKNMPLAPKNINSGYYEKVTDASTLENGDAILIVNETGEVAMSTTQNSNNRAKEDITFLTSGVTYAPKATVQKLVLVKKTEKIETVDTEVFYFYTGEGYLYAASGSSNHLKTETTPDDNNNARATISISSGDATITFKGTNSRNLLKYNSSDKIFSCYGSGQTAVQIYKEVAHNETFSPAKKYTTLTSAYNLDFTGVSGLEAYIATSVSAGSVQLTQVNKVPANTGLVLKATTPGSAVNVPVFDGTGADDVDANKMAGSATETTAIAANAGYILKDGVFHPASAGTLAAGKAYLAIAASAPVLNLDFGGTTGIKSVDSGKVTVDSSEVYNLNGQRVAQPTKGLYIVNGKKVIIK